MRSLFASGFLLSVVRKKKHKHKRDYNAAENCQCSKNRQPTYRVSTKHFIMIGIVSIRSTYCELNHEKSLSEHCSHRKLHQENGDQGCRADAGADPLVSHADVINSRNRCEIRSVYS